MFEKMYKRNLLSHICLYPYLKFEDIYKFLYQAVCGNVHLLESKENFIKSLNKELQIIDEKLALKNHNNKKKNKNQQKIEVELELNNEPLIEYLRKDKKYIRLNLRPYLKSGYDPDILKEACILSAEKNKENEEKDKEDFVKIWSEFSKEVFDQSFYDECEKYCKKFFSFSPTIKDKTKEFFKINLSYENLEKFNFFIVSKNYPIIHHSQEYLYLYKPSYRVLERKVLLSKLKLNS